MLKTMRGRGMRGRRWSVTFLVGLGVLAVACAGAPAGTTASGLTSSTATLAPLSSPSPSPSPMAGIAPTGVPTPTFVAVAGCTDAAPQVQFVKPPGPLPTAIPLPPGTYVGNVGQGIQAGSALYTLCSPGRTSAEIMAFMDAALPAAGWLRNSVPACTHGQGYPWYKGKYGLDLGDDGGASSSDIWGMDICPHVGEV